MCPNINETWHKVLTEDRRRGPGHIDILHGTAGAGASSVGFRFLDGPRILCCYMHTSYYVRSNQKPVDHLFPATGTWIHTYLLSNQHVFYIN